jgi:hypothetical protein
MNLVEEVKKKKEFSGLPDSVVKRALEESSGDVKDARKILRKYFGVFLTNRVLGWKSSFHRKARFTEKLVSQKSSSQSDGGLVAEEDILKFHISSKKRDYGEFYSRIFLGIENVGSVIDLGCGVNGFSYEFLPKGVFYVGIEAASQLVEKMNFYFSENKFNAKSVCLDLFDLDSVKNILVKAKKRRIGFLFQVVDALESMKRNFSKEFIFEIMKELEVLVISLPLVSLGGGKKFAVRRKWLVDFLESEFLIERDFEMFGERILVVRRKDI